MRLIDERKKFVKCFGLFETKLSVNIKNKNIECTDFLIVNAALILHPYEENKEFYTRVHKKDISFVFLK